MPVNLSHCTWSVSFKIRQNYFTAGGGLLSDLSTDPNFADPGFCLYVFANLEFLKQIEARLDMECERFYEINLTK